MTIEVNIRVEYLGTNKNSGEKWDIRAKVKDIYAP